ncbi:MAG: ABC-type transport auxiliary lipoprotein family protein [Lautropia sp.]|nr:ABC-type transport auxiliary lipoprotein family protein [Lautropia sp.]
MSKAWVLGAGLMLAGCLSQTPVHFYSLYAPQAGGTAEHWPVPGALAGSGEGQPALRFELAQVSVPERLNRPQIVIHPAAVQAVPGAPSSASAVAVGGGGQRREAAGGAVEGQPADTATKRQAEAHEVAKAPARPLQILEHHRLDAVFGDAFRDALATHLATLASGRRLGRSVEQVPLLRLDLTVYRFDGASDGRFDAMVDWRVRRLGEVSEHAYAGLGCRFQVHDQSRPDDVPALVASMQQQIRALAVQIVEASRQWLQTGKAECPSEFGPSRADGHGRSMPVTTHGSHS